MIAWGSARSGAPAYHPWEAENMLLLAVSPPTVAIFWLASREKPLYSKRYFETRSDGVFRSDYTPGFREYIEALDKEVRMRFTIGLPGVRIAARRPQCSPGAVHLRRAG
jgi:hypothetical protein